MIRLKSSSARSARMPNRSAEQAVEIGERPSHHAVVQDDDRGVRSYDYAVPRRAGRSHCGGAATGWRTARDAVAVSAADVPIGQSASLARPSYVQVDNIQTVAKARFVKYPGALDGCAHPTSGGDFVAASTSSRNDVRSST